MSLALKMAVAERSTNRRVTAVAVVVALGLALAAVVATVGSNSEAQPTKFDSLLDRSAADTARKASYQGNVGTVYDHLQQIIDKILWHKDAWEKSYKGDLTRVADEVAAAVQVERDASKASDVEAGKAAAAAAIAASMKNAWVGKAAALTTKQADAAEETKALKALFEKGNDQKGGEIEMIKKIRCMMSEFNKDDKWKCDGSDPTSAPTSAPTPHCEDKLAPGKQLTIGKYLMSCNGKNKAIMQSDGNFVIYQDGTQIWSTQTTNKGGQYFEFKTNGQLVMFKADGGHTWATDTAGSTLLKMEDDGNLVLYQGNTPRWSSKKGLIKP